MFGFVNGVHLFFDVGSQNIVGVLDSIFFRGQKRLSTTSVRSQDFVLGSLQFGGGGDGAFNSGPYLFVNFMLGELGHTLEHSSWWGGTHKLEDSGGTEFLLFSGVLVDLEQDRAGSLWFDECQFVQSGDHLEALEVRALFFTFEVGFESAKNSLVGDVAEGTDEDGDLVGVVFFDGFVEVFGQLGDVFVFDEFFSFSLVESAEDVDGELSPGGAGIDVNSADQAGETKVDGVVDWSAFLNGRDVDEAFYGLHVLDGWDASAFQEGSNGFGGECSGDFLALDQIFDGVKSWTGSGFGDGIDQNFEGGDFRADDFSGVELVDGVLHFLEVHDAQEGGQDEVFFQSHGFLDFFGSLHDFSDFPGEVDGDWNEFNLTGFGDDLSFVAGEEGQKRNLRWLVDVGFRLEFVGAH